MEAASAKRMERKRKLSPSGSKARIVEGEDGSVTAFITDGREKCVKLSHGAIRLLHGLLCTVLSGTPTRPRVRLPLKRQIDFDSIYDIELVGWLFLGYTTI